MNNGFAMKLISSCFFILVSVNFVVTNSNSNDIKTEEDFEPKWTYSCIQDQGCQRSKYPHGLNRTDPSVYYFYESVDLCRLVCGRFGGLWPKPSSVALSLQTVKFHPSFIRFDLIDVPVETRPLLVEMSQLVIQNMMLECGGNITDVVETPVKVYISVKSPSLVLDWNTNEDYLLDVKSKVSEITVHIIAQTVYGARHALETLTQLTSENTGDYEIPDVKCSIHLVSGAKIRDKPVFKHRGLVLDTSRNFMPLKAIMKTIDGMGATKMNVFHWHVTDSHSFPLESSRVPQFTRYGAYSQSEIYTVEEVQELIRYAQVRGVRIVIEIDAPAHAGNGWQWGRDYKLGDLAVCVNSNNWRQNCIQPPCGQLNPANQEIYKVLSALYADIIEMLPKPVLFHMGGDEVYFGCWNSTEEIVDYMKKQNLQTDVEGFISLWGEFHKKALNAWDKAYKESGGNQEPVMLWSSELTKPNRIERYLDPSRYIIEVWEPVDSPLLMQLVRKKYRVVSVPKDIWYLDHGFWGNTRYSNWRRMYEHTLPNELYVLGGEVAMWSEYVDAQVLDTRIWPRAASVAERLWSDPTSSAITAEPRMQRLRKQLIKRGIKADALSPGWCSQHDFRCL